MRFPPLIDLPVTPEPMPPIAELAQVSECCGWVTMSPTVYEEVRKLEASRDRWKAEAEAWRIREERFKLGLSFFTENEALKDARTANDTAIAEGREP